MKLSKRNSGLVATAIAAALLMTACGGGDDEGGEGGGSADGGGSYSLAINNPENPLVPGNTTESEGAQVIKALWTGLIEYAEDGEVQYTGIAESIESDDNTTWTITLKDGWTFHDGTPVTASSFVDAWNYTAYSPNAQGGSYFLSNIVGYKDLQAPTDDAGEITGDPVATEMTGLEVVDDQTFTVTLNDPFAQFPVTVGYNAFFPMAEAFFEDPEAAALDTPIGTGPFQAEGPFEEGVGITLSKYDDYAGENEANAETLEIDVYSEITTSYRDVQGGNLDVVKDIPADVIATAPAEFGDRFIERPSSSFTYLGVPTYDPRFADKRVRQAFSMAIDRGAITDAIFNGTFTPATDAIAPVVDGYREGACEYCELDVERANQLLDEAGFDRSMPVDLWFNAGASHDAWVEAVGNQLRENLGIEYTLQGNLEFAEYLPLLDSKGITGPFRLGWAMDYPSPQNYLEPLYSTAALPPAGSNVTFYSNPEFDQLIAQGNQAETNEEAIDFYQQADDIILEDMPIIPMFFGVEQIVHSEDVSDVVIDVFGQIDTARVKVN
ncbi:peptide ABC transporter substrate-binding protein [Blastococcus saxobsidens]|uniref:ABC-type oligopeptide transport system, substrate-binding component n=1 Tax=Blastococcus saxobsidens (strain DD2) TaxID=1146883 RepID=H6RUB9_BLASD|nr:ABC transporter substrate-binding protein [Blastococcus saxobsidens]CCG01884.1 ABC-type oligopeptide transport system, substrate-binding component [Blastococcus saxobsidens DD2]